MTAPRHPILGDYALNKFGAAGYAICHDGAAIGVTEGRIALNSSLRSWHNTLAIDDRSPDETPRRRFHLMAMPLTRIERMLVAYYYGRASGCRVTGPEIGSVQHVLGRQAEDYINLGSTSQDFECCAGDVSVDETGMTFEFSGSLSRKGFLDDVVPSLFMPSYSIRCHLTWHVACFFFEPNTIALLYGKFGVPQGD